MKSKEKESDGDDEQPIVSWCSKFYKDVRQSSAAKQVTVGAIGGWLSGFVFTKFGKIAATGVGVTILVFHYAHHNGYVKVNWNRVNNDVQKAKKEIGKRAEKELPELLDKTQAFIVENMLLAGGFAGGFCLGVASA
ncbi:FUN14 family protein-like protein [Leptotrombidium deliense]|uniref:FUN14 family protein-like protein n=1 Tax=Leptotrombidium deliense TaxID=299467 RepID=A0A443SSG3_9ACAR|nr:FUN14 family protein-like protein [Leptotrombidium deliense]